MSSLKKRNYGMMYIVLFCLLVGQGVESVADNSVLGESPQTKPVNIVTCPVVETDTNEILTVAGETRAFRDITYSAEISGQVEQLSVDIGDRVVKGQTMARIDFEMLAAVEEEAKSSLELAQKTYARVSALLSEELTTQQSVDEANSYLIRAQAQHRIAGINLRKSEIHSEIAGIVSEKFIEKGEFAVPGMPLIRVVDYTRVYVDIEVPETVISRLKTGMETSVFIDALGERYSGRIDAIVPVSDLVSKTFTVRILMDNPGLKVLVGMAATVTITVLKFENVIVVPQEVVIVQHEQQYVFVAREGLASRRIVRTGPVIGQNVIISEGLKADDQLIIVGFRELVDGAPVTIVRQEPLENVVQSKSEQK